jgi:mannosyltransferase OCH1-like enzyme
MKIPNKLWHVWVGPKTPPTSWMNTWKEKHPSWEYAVIDNNYIQTHKFYNQHLIDEYYRREFYNGVADLIRYEILYEFGGFMPPADAICLENTNELWNQEHEFCYTVYESETLRPNFVSPIYAANSGNKFLKLLIEDLHKLTPCQLKNKVFQSTGNEYVANMIRQHTPKIKIFPSHYFIPCHYTMPDVKYAGPDKIYADQLWGSTKNLYGNESIHNNSQ